VCELWPAPLGKWSVLRIGPGPVLTSLTRKDTAFNWTNECSEASDELKRKLTTTPVLHHYHPDRETIVETDASDGFCAGVLSQRDPNDGHFQPVAYYSESMHGESSTTGSTTRSCWQ
jgi:hypothetical protein